MVNFCFASG